MTSEQRIEDPDGAAGAPFAAPTAAAGRDRLAAHDRPDSAWNRAAAATAQADPFCCRTEWQLSFHEVVRPNRRLVVRAAGRAVLAFALRQDPYLGPLLEPVESSWLFGSPLLGPGALGLLDELLGETAAAGLPPNVLLSGLRADRPLRRQVVRRFGRRYRIVQLEPETLCAASLDGGLDGFLSRRTGAMRRNLRAAARRARDQGVTFERASPRSATAADVVYARMLDVERRSWKGIRRCGMTEPPSRQFYGRLLQRLAAAGTSRVVFARHDGRDIGFIFGGVAGDVYRGQQFSFADEWRRFSIGNLLAIEQVRWLCEDGASRYDMGPAMEYKRHWTELRTRIDALLLHPG